MAIGLHELPKDAPGCLPAGTWHVRWNGPLNAGLGLVQFVNGETIKPIDGRRFRQVVAAAGPSLVGARRVEDGVVVGVWEGEETIEETIETEALQERFERAIERRKALAELAGDGERIDWDEAYIREAFAAIESVEEREEKLQLFEASLTEGEEALAKAKQTDSAPTDSAPTDSASIDSAQTEPAADSERDSKSRSRKRRKSEEGDG